MRGTPRMSLALGAPRARDEGSSWRSHIAEHDHTPDDAEQLGYHAPEHIRAA